MTNQTVPDLHPVTGEELPPAIDAATLIVFRQPDPDRPPELLLVERAASMAFAAGAIVFPGGRVDPADHDLAHRLAAHVDEAPGDINEAAARIAAIRETVEETGLLPAITPQPSAQQAMAIRQMLNDGAPLDVCLAEFGLEMDINRLVGWSRWRPPHAEVRIFDTRFYLFNMGTGAVDLLVDSTENRRLFWASAQAVLDRADRGEVKMIFPTRRNMERLAGLNSFAEAEAHARRFHPVRKIMPMVEDRGGVPHLCIPDDLGYPVTSEPLTSAMRG